MESTREYFIKLLSVFWSIFWGMLLLLAIAIWVIKPDREDDYDLHYMISDLIVMIVGFIIAYYCSNKMINRAKIKRGLHEKLILYRKSMVLRWIIIAFTILYSVFAFIMTREYLFVCTTLFSIGVLFVGRSSVKILSDHLDLTTKEKSVLKVPDAAI